MNKNFLLFELIFLLAAVLNGQQPVPPACCFICEKPVKMRVSSEHAFSFAGTHLAISAVNDAPACLEKEAALDSAGAVQVCFTCPEILAYRFTPKKNGEFLEGVTLIDLITISRHILGEKMINDPYRLIAADVDASGSITANDVFTLKKLMLGNTPARPPSVSWRFIDKAFAFPSPGNPFVTHFPEFIEVSDISRHDTLLDFIAIKVGRAHQSVIARQEGAKRPPAPFALSEMAIKNGNTITIPVTYTGRAPLEAVQLGLRFDPRQLKLISPSLGDVPGYTADYFGLARLAYGEIQSLWLADLTEEWNLIAPGTVLFNLTFEVLDSAKVAHKKGLLVFDNSVLPNAAWSAADEEYEVVEPAGDETRQFLPGEKINPAFHAVCVPNPTSSAASLQLYSRQVGKGYVALFGAYGNQLFMQSVNWQAGEQRIEIPGLVQQPAGVYRWAIFGGGNSTQGLVIKH